MGAVLPVNLVEFSPQPLKEPERRLGHIVQNLVFGMLRGDLQASGHVVEHQFPQIFLA